MHEPKYKRIVLKLSGEALKGDGPSNNGKESQGFINNQVIGRLADSVKAAHDLGVQIAIVVGGGNIFRGADLSAWGMDRSAADYVGMLATIMNCLILQDVLKTKGLVTRVQTAIAMPAVAEPFIRLRAMRHLEKGRVVIFGGGTGNPHVTTDTAAALRAAEVQADAILMAKNKIDGIYTADPRTNPGAKKIETITYDQLLREGLKVMDAAAVSLCQQNHVPIIVFDFAGDESIKRISMGEKIGTLVTG